MEILINKQLAQEQLTELSSHTPENDPILFAIVGDLSDKAHYSHTALAVTAECFFTYDFDTGRQGEIYKISEVEDRRKELRCFPLHLLGCGSLRRRRPLYQDCQKRHGSQGGL